MHRMVKVHMLANNREYVERQVYIETKPNQTELDILNAVYTRGQNDIDPQPICSVSKGDVIELDNEFHMVVGIGFAKIKASQFEVYKIINQRDRDLVADWMGH